MKPEPECTIVPKEVCTVKHVRTRITVKITNKMFFLSKIMFSAEVKLPMLHNLFLGSKVGFGSSSLPLVPAGMMFSMKVLQCWIFGTMLANLADLGKQNLLRDRRRLNPKLLPTVPLSLAQPQKSPCLATCPATSTKTCPATPPTSLLPFPSPPLKSPPKGQ